MRKCESECPIQTRSSATMTHLYTEGHKKALEAHHPLRLGLTLWFVADVAIGTSDCLDHPKA
eukprot:6474492-Amphidinium_carterae.1